MKNEDSKTKSKEIIQVLQELKFRLAIVGVGGKTISVSEFDKIITDVTKDASEEVKLEIRKLFADYLEDKSFKTETPEADNSLSLVQMKNIYEGEHYTDGTVPDNPNIKKLELEDKRAA